MKCLDLVFDDKRLAISILMIWMVIVTSSLQNLDLMHAEFMTFGPSNHTKFMTLSINTWDKWWLLAGATFANSCVSDFMADAIAPWIQNTIQDHKAKYLPYRKFTCYTICQLWAVYCSVMSIFAISLMTSQIDFLIVRMFADLMTNTFTMYKFMRNKQVDRHKYALWSEERFHYVTPDSEILVDLQEEAVQPR